MHEEIAELGRALIEENKAREAARARVSAWRAEAGELPPLGPAHRAKDVPTPPRSPGSLPTHLPKLGHCNQPGGKGRDGKTCATKIIELWEIGGIDADGVAFPALRLWDQTPQFRERRYDSWPKDMLAYHRTTRWRTT